MQYENIIVERTGPDQHVAVVTVNRPHAMNSMTTATGHELHHAFEAIRADAGVRCVILTGAGEKAFSTGADLKERKGMTDEQFLQQHKLFEDVMFGQLLRIEVPTIAAVEGFCLAGGCERALACDFIVASETAVFGLPEVMRGIFPGGGGTQFLPRLVGKAFAKELIFTGRRVDAQEALARGIINHLVPAGQARSKALEIAQTIVSNAPIAVRQAKKAIDRGYDMDLDNGLAFSIEAYNMTVGTEDRREGILAFNEKREARFQNR